MLLFFSVPGYFCVAVPLSVCVFLPQFGGNHIGQEILGNSWKICNEGRESTELYKVWFKEIHLAVCQHHKLPPVSHWRESCRVKQSGALIGWGKKLFLQLVSHLILGSWWLLAPFLTPQTKCWKKTGQSQVSDLWKGIFEKETFLWVSVDWLARSLKEEVVDICTLYPPPKNSTELEKDVLTYTYTFISHPCTHINLQKIKQVHSLTCLFDLQTSGSVEGAEQIKLHSQVESKLWPTISWTSIYSDSTYFCKETKPQVFIILCTILFLFYLSFPVCTASNLYLCFPSPSPAPPSLFPCFSLLPSSPLLVLTHRPA